MAALTSLESICRTKELLVDYIRMAAIPFLLYLLSFVIFTYPAFRKFWTHFFADGGDGLQNVWNIWWVEEALTVLHQSPWHTQYLHFPYGVTLLSHTLNPLNGVFGIVLSTFLDAVPVHNVIVVFSFVVGGITAFLLAYYLTSAYWPSVASGFIFTFSNFHFMHATGHLQLVSLEFIPLFVLMWLRLLSAPTIGLAVTAALVLFLVILCDYYYFLYCCMTAVIILGWRIVREEQILRLLERRYLLPLGTFCVVTFATSGFLAASLLMLILREPLVGAHSPEEFSLDLLAPFVYGAHWRFASLTRGYWTVLGNENENSVYLGLSVIGLLIYVWCKRRLLGDRRAELMFFILLFFFVLALGPSLHVWGMRAPHLILPYKWFEWVFPALKSSGMPVRMMVMVSLTAAILSAYGFKLLCQASRRGRIVSGVLFAMLVIEYLPAPIRTTEPLIPQYVTILQGLPGHDGVVDIVSGDPGDEVLSMLYQTHHRKPIAFGYVARIPTRVYIKDQELRSLIEQRDFRRLWQEYHLRYLVSKDPAVNKLFEAVETSRQRPLIWTDGELSLFDLSML